MKACRYRCSEWRHCVVVRELTRLMCRGNCILSQWRRQDFVTGGSEVWVYRGSRVRSPPVLVVLSVYQRGSSLDGLAMYLSCDTKKFHDNESTHILSLHNFWTSTHRGGEASPFPPSGGATVMSYGRRRAPRLEESIVQRMSVAESLQCTIAKLLSCWNGKRARKASSDA